jgi:hypothetical protein
MKVYEFIATAKWGVLAAGFCFFIAGASTLAMVFDS